MRLSRKRHGSHPDFAPGTRVRYSESGPSFGLQGRDGVVVKGWLGDTHAGWVTVDFGSTATHALCAPVFLERIAP